jgi:hypothetical protein
MLMRGKHHAARLESAAFFRAFARVFLVACGATALQANLLTTGHGHADTIGQNGFGAAFAVCFGSDFVGHDEFQSKNSSTHD